MHAVYIRWVDYLTLKVCRTYEYVGSANAARGVDQDKSPKAWCCIAEWTGSRDLAFKLASNGTLMDFPWAN